MLRAKAFSAVRWTAVSAASRALLNLVQLATLARMLLPEDYGLMAMVTAIIGFAGIFSDFGFNSAFLQRTSVTLSERSSLFWANVLLSCLVMAVVMLCAPLLVHLMKNEHLFGPLLACAPIFVFNALGQQLKMSAEKSLDFRPVIISELLAAIFGFSLSIAAAALGFGVYSLVVGAVATSATFTLLAWWLIRHDWQPQWRLRSEDLRSYLGFGSAMVGNALVNQFSMNLDLLVGGRLLSSTMLGYFSVPRNLMLQIQFLLNPVVTRVGFPLIASIQNDVTQVRQVYLKTLNMTASINAPLYLGICFFSDEIVRLLLGENWSASTGLMQILALWGYWRSTGNPVGSLLFGMGRAALALRWNLIMLPVVSAFLWAGSAWGAEGLAWSLLAFQACMFLPGWKFLVYDVCGASFFQYSWQIFRPLLIAAGCIWPVHLLAESVDIVLLRLVLVAVAGAILYLLVSRQLNPYWYGALRELVGLDKGNPPGN